MFTRRQLRTARLLILCGTFAVARAAPAVEPPAQSPIATEKPAASAPAASVTTDKPAAPNAAPLPHSREQLPLGAPADRSAAVGVPSAPAPVQSNGWMLQTITALGVVIGMIFVLRFVLQRTGALQRLGGLGGVGGLVEVLARTPIAPKTHLLFLRINQRIIIAAQSPSGISNLANLDSAEDVAWILGRVQAAKSSSISRSFLNILSAYDKEHDKAEGGDTAEHSVDRTRHQLSGLMGNIRRISKGGE